MPENRSGSSSSDDPNQSVHDQADSGRRRRPFAFQPVLNRIVQVALRTPLLSRVIGKGLITLYVVGRRSGKRYTVPMAYVRHEEALLLGSGFSWGKNLRTGEPLEVLYKGRRCTADVRVLTGEADVVEHYAVIARKNPGFARINNITIARDGTPDPADLRSAWASGARVFLLTLR